MLNWNPEEGLKHILHVWKKRSERVVHEQDEAISSFSNELEKMERNMDKISNATYSYWLPLIKECKKDASNDMKGTKCLLKCPR